jgi:single-stranded-DNA-specific exonuclease
MGKGKNGCQAAMVLDALSLPAGVDPPQITLPQVNAAASSIIEALKEGERIAVFADYDPDGTCGAAALGLALSDYQQQTLWGFASAQNGTGLSEDFIREAASQGCTQLITIDLGSSGPALIELAKELGMTITVSDHHSPHPDADPDYHLNPQLQAPSQASGAVVAYKLALALESELYGQPRQSTIQQGAWLAGLGARADMMDMKTSENAALNDLNGITDNAPLGMQILQEKLGLKSLSRSNQSKISSILNLPKRCHLAKAEDAAQILMSDDPKLINDSLSNLLAVKEACDQASKDFGSQAAQQITAAPASRVASAIIDSEDSHLYSGYSGIVSMRMSGAAKRPAVVFVPMNPEASMYKYSARWTGAPDDAGEGLLTSIPGLEAVNSPHGLGPPGGHPQAMGGICRAEDIAAVTESLEAWAANLGLAPLVLEPYSE